MKLHNIRIVEQMFRMPKLRYCLQILGNEMSPMCGYWVGGGEGSKIALLEREKWCNQKSLLK